MKSRRVSAEDVAREAGVSRTTVSFVLNNTPGKSISEPTRQRVLMVASKLGYTPNEYARRLALLRHNAIGLYISHSQYVYTDAFIVRTVEGMAQAVNRHRVRLTIHPVRFSEDSYLQLAQKDEVDGIILINAHDNDPALTEVVESGFPCVSMDYLPDTAVDQVYVDNRRAAEEVIEYLVDLGHRRIAMITHASVVYSASKMRFEGYRSALEAAAVGYDERLVRFGDFSEQSGYDAMQQLLELQPRPTALFAGNDVIAYGAMSAIRDHGLSIPEDISVVGFDDDYLSRYLNPPLTTVALPAAGMGSAAVSLLIGRLDSQREAPPSRVVLPAHVSVRASCSRLDG